MWLFSAGSRGSLPTWRQEDSINSGQKRLLRHQTMKEAGVNQPLEFVGRGLGNQQQPSGAGKPSKIRRYVVTLCGRGSVSQ
ncbi:Hypothetical predicted protein [Podarcis lilfordi]|uniref:Uncharacterized protein n=1 Tax=Podarcis lilfordi TaxID=74358 RepID=A0AA35LLX0_9SAUR|nr:Hypothetical predicted protein [Podarcis lilfordi]